MPDIGPAGVRANIEYYKSVKRKYINQVKLARRELKYWESIYEKIAQ